MRFGVVALAVTMLAGCLGPVELPRLADVDMAEDAPKSGLIAPNMAASDTVLRELQGAGTKGVTPSVDQSEKPRFGLGALFGRRNNNTEARESAGIASVTPAAIGDEAAPDVVANPTQTAVAEQSAQGQTEDVLVASLTPVEPENPRRQKRGLFGPRRTKANGPTQVDPGIILPYGEVGVACGIRGRALGKEVDRFPDRGKGYRLYDTDPLITGPRTHYLTGFKDGCPRQFTAALAFIGSPILHEQMRYDQYNKDLPFTAADVAYEKIKTRICRTEKGQPCPEARTAALEKGMAFVTMYERFGGNASWEEILLHNGAIAASSARAR